MFRKITSLTALLSFLVTLITSVILYIVPEGRVAYWADWHLLGMTKTQWGDVHTTVGTLFLIALILHIWLNWKPIMNYMKNRARELVVMTTPMIVSFVLVFLVFAGTLVGLPPMSTLLDYGAQIKEDATETYGNPPYGHAETSPLKKFCGFLGLDVDKALAALHEAGFDPSINGETLVKDIARSRNMSPQHVYDIIRAKQGGDPFALMPVQPPEGTGKLTVAVVCKTYGLELEEVLARLKGAGIDATPESSFKTLASEHDMSPKDIYAIVRGQ
ncbi:hypothetical protein DND132_1673 [Pseudodesulfovibrio mercurii]|uniref:Flavinylation-associated cytochrome domain-containing protein n=1 Tax=Pseudodesulfovibrio mercurii TaxID=641491 RepID=F0JFF5_9BACT|nr:DUF4405 domain-containing protein [Pseudodesulfovibrio mercurii]EGB14879.1 hypothetical protein DND132_1673 [Pseudodesulfovibrio mercurii]